MMSDSEDEPPNWETLGKFGEHFGTAWERYELCEWSAIWLGSVCGVIETTRALFTERD